MELNSFIDSLTTHDAMFEIVVGQGRLLTLKQDVAAPGKPSPVIAIGDPTVLDFQILPNPRLIRLVGLRAGITELSVTTSLGQTYSLRVHVVYDLRLLEARLRQLFPDAHLKLAQLRDHIVVEGEARSTKQIASIIETIRAYLKSVQVAKTVSGQQGAPAKPPADDEPGLAPSAADQFRGRSSGVTADPEQAARPTTQATLPQSQVINLLRVPGPQQVMLKVQVAELNRSAMREFGADFLFSQDGVLGGSQIGGASSILPPTDSVTVGDAAALAGIISSGPAVATTAFGIFENAHLQVFLAALRRNTVLKILAEPNLVAMNGHEASFLAGGEFPVPIPQSTTGGAGTSVTVEFRQFGVRLGFVPFTLDDDKVRLTVSAEVSSIDFSVGTTLVPGGDPVPGLISRRAQTTVELREGKTLMIAGLLQVTLDGATSRIPVLGDLPMIGSLFRNTSGTRQEKELVVLVTPYLVEAVDPDEVPPLPGEDVNEPTDLELFFLGRIEGRISRDYRSTTDWDSPNRLLKLITLEKKYVRGPHGYSN